MLDEVPVPRLSLQPLARFCGVLDPRRNATRAFRVDSDSHCEATRAFGVDSNQQLLKNPFDKILTNMLP